MRVSGARYKTELTPDSRGRGRRRCYGCRASARAPRRGADSHSHVPAGVLDTKLLLEVGGEGLRVLLVELGVDIVQTRLRMTSVRSEAL